VQYDGRKLSKTSPEKQTRPGRKSIKREFKEFYAKDVVSDFKPEDEDLLIPFNKAENMAAIQKRLTEELSRLQADIKKIRNPAEYKVVFQ
jgi:hypothetical protein